MRARLLFVPVVVGLVLAGPVAAAAAPRHTPARAAMPASPSVTLRATPTLVPYGKAVTFTGRIKPAAGGETVDIVDGTGAAIATDKTAADGTYKTSAVPKQNISVHAEWTTVTSLVVHLHVKPRLTGSRSPFLLFGKVHVTGRLVPPRADRKVSVTLSQSGRTLKRVAAKVGVRGRFSANIPLDHLGRQRVVVYARSRNFAPTSWRSNPGTPPTPGLHVGSSGIFVRLLQGRLHDLHYRVAAINGNFDARTADAVMAFHKAQAMARTQYVDLATWRALSTPKRPVARSTRWGYHFEVSLAKQLLYYVHNGKIIDILHVSTGKPSTPTLPGQFHVDLKVPGFNQERMYYSSFFDGNRAMHGYAEVPSYAASHGCVRMPYWNAKWVYNRAPIGIFVWVY